MTHADRQMIERLASQIRQALDLAVPVDVEAAVTRLNGELTEVTDSEFEAKIEKLGDRFRICLAGGSGDTRRRFSIAHELGHLFLHMGYLIDEQKWQQVGNYTDSVYFRYGFTEEEYAANEFAAALLMPRNEFVSIAEQNRANNNYKIGPIAEHFQVSPEAARTRGRWLNIFAWD